MPHSVDVFSRSIWALLSLFSSHQFNRTIASVSFSLLFFNLLFSNYFRIDAVARPITSSFPLYLYVWQWLRLSIEFRSWNPLHLINMTCATSNKIDPIEICACHRLTAWNRLQSDVRRALKREKKIRRRKLSENVIRKWIEMENHGTNSVIKYEYMRSKRAKIEISKIRRCSKRSDVHN